MTHQIEFSPKARRSIRQAYMWAHARAPRTATRWLARLNAAIDSLSIQPFRFALAPESEHTDRETRQMLYGKKPNVYRILYRVYEKKVLIVNVKHAAQDTSGSDE